MNVFLFYSVVKLFKYFCTIIVYKKIMVNIYKRYFVVYTIFIVAKRKVLWLLSSIGFIIIKAKGVMLLNVVIGGCSVNEQIW